MDNRSAGGICQKERIDLLVETKNEGQRLDQFLSQANLEKTRRLSRSMYKDLIVGGAVLVNGKREKASFKPKANDQITLYVPPLESLDLIPEKILFEIVFEDSEIIVISKPPNLVVHPACGHQSGTLVHGLLFHCTDLGGINGTLRPGIIHRLDKDTSGLMVVAKNDYALAEMVRQFKAKTVRKIYLAIVHGCPKEREGTVRGNIGRHPVSRKKMAVLTHGGRESTTHWRLVEEFKGFSLMELQLETGRTHQIRVHMASIGLPVAGDEIYGKKKNNDPTLGIQRQCLHAAKLSFTHPSRGELLDFSAPLWPDMENTLRILRQRYL